MTLCVGVRLKEERNRLGYSQSKVAQLVGSSKNTVIAWEKGNTSPNLVQISVLFENGFNILYIISGEEQATSDRLQPDESKMLGMFRQMHQKARVHILELSRLLRCIDDEQNPWSPNGGSDQLRYVIEQVETILQDEHMVLMPDAKARVINACLVSLQEEGEEITAKHVMTAIRAVK